MKKNIEEGTILVPKSLEYPEAIILEIKKIVEDNQVKKITFKLEEDSPNARQFYLSETELKTLYEIE